MTHQPDRSCYDSLKGQYNPADNGSHLLIPLNQPRATLYWHNPHRHPFPPQKDIPLRSDFLAGHQHPLSAPSSISTSRLHPKKSSTPLHPMAIPIGLVHNRRKTSEYQRLFNGSSFLKRTMYGGGYGNLHRY